MGLSHRTDGMFSLIDEFAIEGDTHLGEQHPRIAVVGGRGMDHDVTAWDHLGRVPRNNFVSNRPPRGNIV